eukprot:9468233-Pyramimonas_sp.AAC.1
MGDCAELADDSEEYFYKLKVQGRGAFRLPLASSNSKAGAQDARHRATRQGAGLAHATTRRLQCGQKASHHVGGRQGHHSG